jgi:hypothetical protein
VPEQVLHRLVLHHLARGDQHREDNAASPAIDDRVGLVAQVGSAALEAHRRRIRIGGADAEISGALVVVRW